MNVKDKDQKETFLPDLMILDVMMDKNLEGFKVSRELQKHEDHKKIPVILLTGIRDKMNLAFGFEPDNTGLPVKAVPEITIRPEQLLEKMEEFIK